MAVNNNSAPITLETQLKNMKSYVHFIKKVRMTAFLSHTGYFRCSRYGKFLISHANDIGTKPTHILPCWVFFSYVELGTIINIYAYLRGDLRTYVLKYGYSKNHYGKSTTKQFDTWLEALRNLRNIYAHHNILVGKTSSVVLPEIADAQVLVSGTDLLSRIYSLKKILPISEHEHLKHDLQKLMKHSKIEIYTLGILPKDWESRYDNIFIL